jgi:GDP-mannose pyrophosphatase NudK
LIFNTATKKVVLSKQFRMPVYAKGMKNIFSMEVCGSAFDENELLETTVIREIQEENNRFRNVIWRCFKKD